MVRHGLRQGQWCGTESQQCRRYSIKRKHKKGQAQVFRIFAVYDFFLVYNERRNEVVFVKYLE